MANSVSESGKGLGNVTPGKNFDSCGAFGPWMVTKDEIDDAQNLQILHRVNGDEIQNGR